MKPQLSIKDIKELKKSLTTARTIATKSKGTIHNKRARALVNQIENLISDLSLDDNIL